MYYNVFGEKVSRKRFKAMCAAARNRRELIAAGLTSRRDLFKMGLLSAGGMLVAKNGLSSRARRPCTTGAVRGVRVVDGAPLKSWLRRYEPATAGSVGRSRCRNCCSSIMRLSTACNDTVTTDRYHR
jgi:hypothetical protein